MKVCSDFEAFPCLGFILYGLFLYFIDFLLEIPAGWYIFIENKVESKDFLWFLLKGFFKVWGIEAAYEDR
jgi:hypothetical protein